MILYGRRLLATAVFVILSGGAVCQSSDYGGDDLSRSSYGSSSASGGTEVLPEDVNLQDAQHSGIPRPGLASPRSGEHADHSKDLIPPNAEGTSKSTESASSMPSKDKKLTDEQEKRYMELLMEKISKAPAELDKAWKKVKASLDSEGLAPPDDTRRRYKPKRKEKQGTSKQIDVEASSSPKGQQPKRYSKGFEQLFKGVRETSDPEQAARKMQDHNLKHPDDILDSDDRFGLWHSALRKYNNQQLPGLATRLPSDVEFHQVLRHRLRHPNHELHRAGPELTYENHQGLHSKYRETQAELQRPDWEDASEYRDAKDHQSNKDKKPSKAQRRRQHASQSKASKGRGPQQSTGSLLSQLSKDDEKPTLTLGESAKEKREQEKQRRKDEQRRKEESEARQRAKRAMKQKSKQQKSGSKRGSQADEPENASRPSRTSLEPIQSNSFADDGHDERKSSASTSKEAQDGAQGTQESADALSRQSSAQSVSTAQIGSSHQHQQGRRPSHSDQKQSESLAAEPESMSFAEALRRAGLPPDYNEKNYPPLERLHLASQASEDQPQQDSPKSPKSARSGDSDKQAQHQ